MIMIAKNENNRKGGSLLHRMQLSGRLFLCFIFIMNFRLFGDFYISAGGDP